MGETCYTFWGWRNGNWIEYVAAWRDGEGYDGEGRGTDWPCLCTFPFNNRHKLSAGDVRSLALLGAAVAMATNDETELGSSETFWGKDTRWVHLPEDVPEWVRNEIKRVVNEAGSLISGRTDMGHRQ